MTLLEIKIFVKITSRSNFIKITYLILLCKQFYVAVFYQNNTFILPIIKPLFSVLYSHLLKQNKCKQSYCSKEIKCTNIIYDVSFLKWKITLKKCKGVSRTSRTSITYQCYSATRYQLVFIFLPGVRLDTRFLLSATQFFRLYNLFRTFFLRINLQFCLFCCCGNNLEYR